MSFWNRTRACRDSNLRDKLIQYHLKKKKATLNGQDAWGRLEVEGNCSPLQEGLEPGLRGLVFNGILKEKGRL